MGLKASQNGSPKRRSQTNPAEAFKNSAWISGDQVERSFLMKASRGILFETRTRARVQRHSDLTLRHSDPLRQEHAKGCHLGVPWSDRFAMSGHPRAQLPQQGAKRFQQLEQETAGANEAHRRMHMHAHTMHVHTMHVHTHVHCSSKAMYAYATYLAGQLAPAAERMAGLETAFCWAGLPLLHGRAGASSRQGRAACQKRSRSFAMSGHFPSRSGRRPGLFFVPRGPALRTLAELTVACLPF